MAPGGGPAHTWAGRSIPARLSVCPVELHCPPAALLEPLAKRTAPVFLDSSALSEDFGRYSILTCEPVDTLRLSAGTMTSCSGDQRADGEEGVYIERPSEER